MTGGLDPPQIVTNTIIMVVVFWVGISSSSSSSVRCRWEDLHPHHHEKKEACIIIIISVVYGLLEKNHGVVVVSFVGEMARTTLERACSHQQQNATAVEVIVSLTLLLVVMEISTVLQSHRM